MCLFTAQKFARSLFPDRFYYIHFVHLTWLSATNERRIEMESQKIQMSREEYDKYKDELYRKYWARSISHKKMNEELDKIELLPYDLANFTALKPQTVKWINSLFEKAPETSQRGNFMIRGFTRSERSEVQVLNLSYGDYTRDLSFYAYNDQEQMLYTFTEGDTTLELFPTKEAYEKEKEYTRNWYKEERGA